MVLFNRLDCHLSQEGEEELACAVGCSYGRVGISFWRRRIWLVKTFLTLKSFVSLTFYSRLIAVHIPTE